MKHMKLKENIELFVDSVDWFKEVFINAVFLLETTPQNVSDAALLAALWSDRSEQYPSKQAFADVSDKLYGTMISARSFIYGKTCGVELSMTMVDPQLTEIDFSKQAMDLFLSFLHHPLINEQTFSEAKRNTLDDLEHQKERPIAYAYREAMQKALGNQPGGLNELGDPVLIQAATSEQIRAFYQRLLNEARVEATMVGPINDQLLEIYANHLSGWSDRYLSLSSVYLAEVVHQQVYMQQKGLSQASLIRIYQCSVRCDSEEYLSVRLANMMYGQFPPSVLFQEVREKRSLCYSISSVLLPYDGLMVVLTGVSPKQAKTTRILIDDLFTDFVNQQPDVALFESARRSLMNQYRTLNDSARARAAFVFRNNRLGIQETPDDVVAAIGKLTIAEVQRASKAWHPTFWLTLSNEEDTHETA